MTSPKPLTIIGGGLAGLTLGIALRQRCIPVTIREAGSYPRHRVCGEFINGRGLKVLETLGFIDELGRVGARTANTAAFFTDRSHSPVRRLAKPALCLSRFTMDATLANHFRQSGGELREHDRWRDDNLDQPGIVHASGRRPCPQENGARWFGLKIHARNAILKADLEMHLVKDGYIGLCRLPEGVVNICGLFRARRASEGPMPPWGDSLRGEIGTCLRERLDAAVFDESSFCSVAGLGLRPQRAQGQPGCYIGDALTMIPPVTGNGMSMAFESAALALEPLTAFSLGETTWEKAQKRIAGQCDHAFTARLFWARWLQWMMFAPALRGQLGAWALRSNFLWRIMFKRTR